jgi:hypothetical protein
VRYHEKRQTVQNKTLQFECGMEVLADHLAALTGQKWSRAELEDLHSVGLSLPISVDRGIGMLDRWDLLWRSAVDLTSHDREELKQMSAFRRWKHLRSNARSQPIRVLIGLLSLGPANYRYLIPASK